jgi:hypothetical protein
MEILLRQKSIIIVQQQTQIILIRSIWMRGTALNLMRIS